MRLGVSGESKGAAQARIICFGCDRGRVYFPNAKLLSTCMTQSRHSCIDPDPISAAWHPVCIWISALAADLQIHQSTKARLTTPETLLIPRPI